MVSLWPLVREGLLENQEWMMKLKALQAGQWFRYSKNTVSILTRCCKNYSPTFHSVLMCFCGTFDSISRLRLQLGCCIVVGGEGISG